jgi:hypothetical protein
MKGIYEAKETLGKGTITYATDERLSTCSPKSLSMGESSDRVVEDAILVTLGESPFASMRRMFCLTTIARRTVSRHFKKSSEMTITIILLGLQPIRREVRSKSCRNSSQQGNSMDRQLQA